MRKCSPDESLSGPWAESDVKEHVLGDVALWLHPTIPRGGRLCNSLVKEHLLEGDWRPAHQTLSRLHLVSPHSSQKIPLGPGYEHHIASKD